MKEYLDEIQIDLNYLESKSDPLKIKTNGDIVRSFSCDKMAISENNF